MSITQRYAWKLWYNFSAFKHIRWIFVSKLTWFTNTENLMIGSLNINSLRKKIIDLREVVKHISLDYFVLSETKLNNRFPCAQFQISDDEIRARGDRNNTDWILQTRADMQKIENFWNSKYWVHLFRINNFQQKVGFF